MTSPSWPWPGDNATDRARRVANSLLALLPFDVQSRAVVSARAVGETWLGPSLVAWDVSDKVTTAQAAELVHVKPSTIRKWHSTGQLQNCGTGYYLVAAVLDCAAARRRVRVVA